MNTRIRTVITFAGVVLILGVLFISQSTSAQSPRSAFGNHGALAQTSSAQPTNSNCKQLKGSTVQVFDPVIGVLSGPITNAGILNGTSEDVVNVGAGFVFTPDPNVINYLSDLTITTINGQLKTNNNLNAFNFVNGSFAEFGSINPNTSTGTFAGATGVLFFTGKTIGTLDVGPYQAEIAGEICFAQ
jgi:hypothetical protein